MESNRHASSEQVPPTSQDALLAFLSQAPPDAHNPKPLRSQAEFLMTGVVPVPDRPEVACSICIERLTDDVVEMVKCGHPFHCMCILGWFQSKATRRGACPNCREELFRPEPLRAAPEPLVHVPPYELPRYIRRPFNWAMRVPPLHERLPQPGAESHTRMFAEGNSDRLPDERETDRLRRLRQLLEVDARLAREPSRSVFDPIRSMSDEIPSEAQLIPGRVLEPSRPSPETAVPNNEHVQRLHERERMLGLTSEHRRPTDTRNVQAPGYPSRGNVAVPPSRGLLASITTGDLMTLRHSNLASSDVQLRCAEELASRLGVPYPHAPSTAQHPGNESESIRSSETTSGASFPYMGTRQTRIPGSNHGHPPHRVPANLPLSRIGEQRDGPAESQHREERATLDNREQWLRQVRAEQAIVAAQDRPTTLSSNMRVPLIGTPRAPLLQPQATRTLFGDSLRDPESLRSHWHYPRRSHLPMDTEGVTSRTSFNNQFPIPQGTLGARNNAPVNQSTRGPLARNPPWNPNRTIYAPRDFPPTWITLGQDADNRGTGSDQSTDSSTVDRFDPALYSAGRH